MDCVAKQVQQDLQHASEFPDCRPDFAFTRPGYADISFTRPDTEDAGRLAGHLGKVDVVRRDRKVGILDYFKIRQIVDQRQKVLPGRCYIRRIVGIFIGQRPCQS